MVRCSVVFATNPGGVATNPTTVTFKTREESTGIVTTGTAVNDSTGNYHGDITPTAVGTYLYFFLGTGAVAAADEGSFQIVGNF